MYVENFDKLQISTNCICRYYKQTAKNWSLSKSSIIIKIEMKCGMFMDCTNSILSTETDPVCKMQVDKRKAKFTSEYRRKKYYFCSLFCKKEFDEKLIE